MDAQWRDGTGRWWVVGMLRLRGFRRRLLLWIQNGGWCCCLEPGIGFGFLLLLFLALGRASKMLSFVDCHGQTFRHHWSNNWNDQVNGNHAVSGVLTILTWNRIQKNCNHEHDEKASNKSSGDWLDWRRRWRPLRGDTVDWFAITYYEVTPLVFVLYVWVYLLIRARCTVSYIACKATWYTRTVQ
jgi:hypothetical protein